MKSSDTIYALASGAGRSGVAILRLSGADVAAIIQTITGRPAPKPRRVVLRPFTDSQGQLIDEGLLIRFIAPHSFTGEDIAEFHTHGSPAVIAAMARALERAGARQAEPGEFTRRAFDNGRMDLTEAEGLADLIDAETQGQHRQALRQMQGGLKDLYENWREGLIDALASIEGEIDFPDELDVPDALSHAAYAPMSNVLGAMEKALSEAGRGERIRAGINIVIIGPPNAGKSTLINRIAQRDAAIVSDEAGTTRDVIDIHLDIGGLPVRLSDTAGLRHTQSHVEAEGVRRAQSRSQSADMRIGVIDGQYPSDGQMLLDILQPGDFLLLNKSDLSRGYVEPTQGVTAFSISALDGNGFDTFHAALEQAVTERFSLTEAAGLTRQRHQACTKRAIDALKRAQSNLAIAPELAGDDVRSALHAIRELAGEADIEAVLDSIFSRFCIGK